MSDRTRLALCVLAVAVVTTVPAACGFLFAPEGWSWTGLAVRNTADVNGYLFHIEETRRHGPFAHNLWTSEPHPPVLVRPVYSGLGWLGKVLPAAPALVLLEAGRLLAALALLALLAWFVSRLFTNPWERVLSLLLLALGGGLGWLRIPDLMVDVVVPEGSTFVTLLSPPHFAVSVALILAVFLALEAAWGADAGRGALVPSLLAAGAGLWLGLEHPFDLLPLGLTVAVALAVEWRRGRRFPLPALLRSLPLAAGAGAALAFHLAVMRLAPVFAEWNRQHVVPAPSLAAIAASLGLLLPLAFLGIRPLLAARPRLGTCILLFPLAAVACSRLPLPYQGRFLEGYPVCVGLLACSGLWYLLAGVRSASLRRAAAVLILGLVIPSAVVVVGRDVSVLAGGTSPQYLPTGLLDAMRGAGQVAARGEAFFSSPFTGNLLPAYSARPVYVGQRVQTARCREKLEVVRQVFSSPASDPGTAALVRGTGARWLFWGPDEAGMSGGEFRPDEAAYLQEAWRNDWAVIYRISPISP